MQKYNPQKIERKWQNLWEKKGLYQAKDFSKSPKFYVLIEFPYPSGDGLHVGHCRPYSALDAVARQKRMEGFNVLFPMGWDAFGLPAENYAIKTGIHPSITVKKNISNFKRQMKSLGLSFDWSREINTTDPKYYKWTQWIFLQLFKNGLAYKAKIPINWCPSCKIGLANEEVVSGKCERCGKETEQRQQEQWMLRITKYADRLIEDLKGVNYLEKIKAQQINWIGRSSGVEIDFKIEGSSETIKVFTTRADTIFGVTAVVIAPENSLVQKIVKKEKKKEVDDYIKASKKKSEFKRTKLEKEKTGVFSGCYCINPANNEKVPIWIGDYVVATYGGGAVMMVPAHDQRDFEFAKRYKIPIKEVIMPVFGQKRDKEEFRKTISAVVQRKSDGKFLFLKWKEFGWIAPVIGGPEDNETIKEAAEREVLEETGYRAKFVKELGGLVESHFFAANKNVWRNRVDQPVLMELVSENPEEVSKDEKNRHEAIWLAAEQALKEMTHKDNNVGLLRYVGEEKAFIEEGRLVNSGEFNGLSSAEAIKKITKRLEEKKLGKKAIHYKLRDWVFSRQHYWGEPIPIIHCQKCGMVSVSEKDLPVKLPFVKKYQPIGTGESPLAGIKNWVNVKCPKCKGPANRETDTMPNWAGSSWYFIRYIDPKNNKAIADQKKLKYWMPVDWYNGGMEHTTLHLLYSRFWYKFLYDIGAVPQSEPYQKRTSHGMVLAEDGRKMSKSWGNVINPDDIVKKHGADTLRVYEMFMGPFDQTIAWDTHGIVGVRRFLERLWNLALSCGNNKKTSKEIEAALHRLIKKVSEDLESAKFNTAVAAFMEFLNLIGNNQEKCGKETIEKLLILFAPFAPFITEELWQKIGKKQSIYSQKWPKHDSKFIKEEKIKLVIQINGKVRNVIEVDADISEKEAKEIALAQEKIKKWMAGKEIKKIIFVKGRLINVVV